MLLVDAAWGIRCMSAPYAGQWHDNALVEDEQDTLPVGSVLDQDKGFQGFVVAHVTIQQPTKKPRGGELTVAHKEENRRIASANMRMEHTIGSVKRCRIVKENMRYWQDRIRAMVLASAAGLHNWRLQFRPWQYETH